MESEHKLWAIITISVVALFVAIAAFVTIDSGMSHAYGYKGTANNAPFCYGPACEE